MVDVAEIDRKLREIEESGKRQVNLFKLGRRNLKIKRRCSLQSNHVGSLRNC